MVDVDLRRLRHFVALAETLNFARAAEVLRLAQPALSRSIAAFERELGVRLFDRSRRGTRLTPAGELLRDEAPGLLASAESLHRRLLMAGRDGLGVTIGVRPGAIVGPSVRHLEKTFPGIRVDEVPTSETDQITGLRDGRFDASFAVRPFATDDLTVVEIYPEVCVVIESRRRSAVLDELVRHAHTVRGVCAL